MANQRLSTQFISARGHEYFCEIDEEYLTDRFNLTGLQQEVQYYQYALDLVTDVFDFECEDEVREQIEKSARHLYGLVHARYIITTRGLAKMVCPPPPTPRFECRLTPPTSSRNTRNATSVAARVYCVAHTPFSPLASQTLPNRNPSSSTVPNARTFTHPSRRATPRLTVPTSVPASRTSSSKSIPGSSRRRATNATRQSVLGSRRMRRRRWSGGRRVRGRNRIRGLARRGWM